MPSSETPTQDDVTPLLRIDPDGATAWAEALAAVHKAAFPPAERWDAKAITAVLSGPGAFAFLDPRGGLILARVAADEAEILTLGVVPERRGAGVGRRLLDAALAGAIDRGAATTFLEVAARNAAGRRLYDGAGFVTVGRRDRYYPDGDDALILARALAPPAG